MAESGVGQWLHNFFVFHVGIPVLQSLDWCIGQGSQLSDEAILENREFAWSFTLESNWQEIRSEAETALQNIQEIPCLQQVVPDLQRLNADDKWKAHFLCAYGEWSEKNCAACPRTTELLKSIPNLRMAFFSVLSPHKHIAAHRGAFKGLVRCHLGLIVPGDEASCRMDIDGQTLGWKEGKLLIFDNSRQHEVWNDTDEWRVILLLDVDRPMRFPWSLFSRLIIQLIAWSPYVRKARHAQRNLQTHSADLRQ